MISEKSGCLFQWDINRKIELEDKKRTITEIHFAAADDDEAMVVPFTREGDVISVIVPNILLQTAGRISLFAVSVAADEVRTVEHYVLNVLERQKPSDYVYVETEVFKYSLLEQRVVKLEQEGKIPGPAGFSPLVEITKTSTGYSFSVTDINGRKSFEIKDGYTPVKGVDYFDGEKGDAYVLTDADKAEIAQLVGSDNFVLKSELAGRLLWQGAELMADSNSAISLSEEISKQANGIVLVFSYFNNGAASNTAFQQFFVSKKFVEITGSSGGGKGAGSNFFLHANGFLYMGTKYLYISNTAITGYNANGDAATQAAASGVKYNNDKFCLRYVLGV